MPGDQQQPLFAGQLLRHPLIEHAALRGEQDPRRGAGVLFFGVFDGVEQRLGTS